MGLSPEGLKFICFAESKSDTSLGKKEKDVADDCDFSEVAPTCTNMRRSALSLPGWSNCTKLRKVTCQRVTGHDCNSVVFAASANGDDGDDFFEGSLVPLS